MRKETKVHLREDCAGYFRLKAAYEEFFTLKKWEIFCEFFVRLVPNPNMEISILIEANNQPEYEMETIEKGIQKAIEQSNHTLNHFGLGFSGFDLYIKSGRFHVIDSKPIGYEIAIMKIVNSLIENEFFEKVMLNYPSIDNLFQLRKFEGEIGGNASERSISIRLLFSNLQSIHLKNSWQATLLYGYNYAHEEKGALQISVKSSYTYSKEASLTATAAANFLLEFDKNIPLQLANSLVSQTKQFVNEIYDTGKNLGGLKIEVKMQNHWRQPYNSVEIHSLYWLLKSLFFKKENTVITEYRFYNKWN